MTKTKQLQIISAENHIFQREYKEIVSNLDLAKKDNGFLEVLHNGEVIYTNKSMLQYTCSLDLQEGERVSSDRLFRVRIKQPYSSGSCF